jgi:hypothetical protein
MAGNRVTTQAKIGTAFRIATDNQGPMDFLVEPPAGGGGSLTNLSNVLFVDGGTTVPGGDQTGNIETPFATITAAVAAAPVGATVIVVTAGDYTGEADISLTRTNTLTITNWNPSPQALELVTSLFSDLVLLPNITGQVQQLVLVGCGYQHIDITGELAVSNCIDNALGTIIADDFGATGTLLRSNITLNGPGGAAPANCVLKDCAWAGSGPLQILCAIVDPNALQVRLNNVDFQSTEVDFVASEGGGTVFTDEFSYQSFRRLAAGLTGMQVVINKTTWTSGDDIGIGGGATAAFPDVVVGGSGVLTAGENFQAHYLFRVGIYENASPGVSGIMEGELSADIQTDGAGNATLTFQTVLVPNISYLPVALAGATFAVAAVANGFRVSVTAPAAIQCQAWFEAWTPDYHSVG